jgi:hypothetical protein
VWRPLIWDAPSGRPLYRWKEENSPDEHTTVKFNKRLRLHLQQSLLSHPLEPKPAPLGRKWTRIEPVMGLEWVPCNPNSTAHKDEILSPSLVSALRRKTAFNKYELDKLDLPVLSTDSFVKVDGKCLHPAPPAPRPSKATAQLLVGTGIGTLSACAGTNATESVLACSTRSNARDLGPLWLALGLSPKTNGAPDM